MKKDFFTKEEISQIRKLSSEGATYADLFEAFPYRKETSLRGVVYRYRLKFARRCKVCCDRKTMLKYIEMGMTNREMSQLIGVTVGQIRYTRRVHGLSISDKESRKCQPVIVRPYTPEQIEVNALRLKELKLEHEIQQAIKNRQSISGLLTEINVIRRKIQVKEAWANKRKEAPLSEKIKY